MKRLRLIAVPMLLLGLFSGTANGAQTAVAGEPRTVPLARTALPTLVGDASGLALRATSDEKELSPENTRFTAVAGETAITQVRVEAAAGERVEDPALRYEQLSGPDGAGMTITPAGEGAGAWRPGQAMPLEKGVDALAWTFERAGTYTIRMVATAGLVRTTPTTDGEPALHQASPEQVSAATDVIVEVSEAADPPAAAEGARSDQASAEESRVAPAADDGPSVPPVRTARGTNSRRATVGAASEAGRSIVLTKGHIDLFEVTYAGGGLQLGVKDDTGLYASGAQYRSPADVSLWVDTALSGVDTGGLPAAYSFLREAADTVYLLPLGQDPELPWPGWSTERLAGTLPTDVHLTAAADAVQLSVAVTGPGEVFTWMTSAFGGVTNRYIDTVDEAADVIPIARNAHVHTAWAFTAPGDYYLTLTPVATTTTGDRLTGPGAVYHVHVGPIADAAPRAGTPPTLSGTGEVGSPIRVDAGRWFPTPHGTTQQWLRDGEPVEGATGTEYSPAAADEGRIISARVTARIGAASTSAETPGLRIGGEPGSEVPEEPQRTSVALAAAATGITLGDRVMLTATVSPRGGTEDQPLGVGGTVELYSGAARVGRTEIGNPVSGAVQFVAVPASVGQHRYTARYLPPAPHLASDSNEVTVTVTAAPDPGPGQPAEDVPNGSLTDSGATVLNRGHVDIASLLEGGRLITRVKDTTESATPVWRDPARTVLQALPEAKTRVPAGEQFRFLGTAGDDLWLLPETQDHSLLWPGWSTEEIPETATATGFDWTLTGIEGPGEFALFTSGAFGEPKVMFNTRDGLPDTATIGRHVHVHGSWAFSAEGVYCLAFDRSTTLTGGLRASDRFTIAVAVGDVAVEKVDPGACFAEPEGRPGAADTAAVPSTQLTDQTTGGVRVLNGGSGFTAGQLVTAQLGGDRAGEWVSAWLHSDPVWLGWAQVGTSGAVQVRLPADAAPGTHRLVLKDRSGTLIGWAALTVVKADSADPPPGGDDAASPPRKTSSSRRCVAGTVLAAGHIDYATRIVDGRLESLIGDDTGARKVFRQPSAVVLWLKPASRVTLPPGYGRIGPPGTAIWQVPQTQRAGLIWLGWNTEALNAGNARGPVRWKLDAVSGPGSVKVYLSGAFGGIQTMVLNGSGSSYDIPLGVHAHANWAFGAQGVYRLRMTQTVTLPDGRRASDTETLTIAVGDVDPHAVGRCGTAAATSPTAAGPTDATGLEAAEQAAAEAAVLADGLPQGPSASLRPGVPPGPVQELAQGSPVPLLLSVLGGLLLTGAVGTGGYWWWRRRWPDLGAPTAGAQ